MTRASAPCLACFALAALSRCSAAQHAPVDPRARDCEVRHTLRGDDELDSAIHWMPDGWLVSLRMRVRVGQLGLVTVRGLGRVVEHGGRWTCQIIDVEGEPGTPRFDEALCLDELESVGDLIDDAENSAGPGQTVVQEVRLRMRRRRRPRRASRPWGPRNGFLERAEVTRDADGRVQRVARTAPDGTREEIVVGYPPGTHGYCLPRGH